MLFFARNTILACFFTLFKIIFLYFLILMVIPNAERPVTTEITTKQAKAEMEIRLKEGKKL